MIIDTDDYIDAREAAKILGIKRNWMSHLCRCGKIRSIKIGQYWIINRKDVELRAKIRQAQQAQQWDKQFENFEEQYNKVINSRRMLDREKEKLLL